MNELSLFTGAGGGVLGTTMLGFKHIGYVEWNEHCQQVIAQRIRDGLISNAPLFGDIRKFNSEGYAESYKGLADVVSAGFPCQPFSASGHQLGEDDPRNMWPATIATIRTVRPKIAWLENVPALLANKYIRRIFADLAKLGMSIRWGVLGTGETGGICTGKRLWILAFTPDCSIIKSLDLQKYSSAYSKESCRRQYTGAVGSMLSQDDYTELKRDRNAVAVGMEQLKAIGNGQDPILAATAFRVLSGIGE